MKREKRAVSNKLILGVWTASAVTTGKARKPRTGVEPVASAPLTS